MVLAVVVFGAIVAMLETSQRVEARDTEAALSLQEARTGLSRMAREIRQASKVEKAEAGTIEFQALIGTSNYYIRYECGVVESGTKYKCVRSAERQKPISGDRQTDRRNSAQRHDGLQILQGNAANTTEPDYVTLKLEMPASGTLKQANSTSYTDHVVLDRRGVHAQPKPGRLTCAHRRHPQDAAPACKPRTA